MSAKISFIIDAIIQFLVFILALFICITNFGFASCLFVIVVILFGVQDIPKVKKDFIETFIEEPEEEKEEGHN